jgi:hypothetical protein
LLPACTDSQQVQELLVQLVGIDCISVLAFFARKNTKFLRLVHHLYLQLQAFFDNFPDLLLRFIAFVLQLHFILLILVLVLLESFLAIIKLFFFHDDVLFQQFCLFSFV